MIKYVLPLFISLPSIAVSSQNLHDCSALPLEAVNMEKEDFQDHQGTIQKLLPIAKDGNETAQHFLASYLLEANPKEAIKWAKLSVENGCVDGALLLGFFPPRVRLVLSPVKVPCMMIRS